MYKNIFVEGRYDDEPTVHIWCDEDGYQKFDFRDYAFIRNEHGDWETMWGDPVMKIPKKNLSYGRKQKLKNAYSEDDAIYESDVPIETRVLVDLYDENRISEGHRRFFYDIEVATEGGFPSPDKANQKITALSYYDEASSRSAVLVLDESGEVDGANHSDIEIFTYSEEERLLRAILKHWRDADPTIISGWNNSDFDDPYLYNRLKKVLGEDKANKLSPIGKVREKRTPSGESGYKFAGIASLDYLNIYENFTFSQEPSYSLDYISNKELDRGKVEYEGMEVGGETVRDLNDLKRLDIERFVEYSHEDVQLIVDIDEKLNFIEMARRISHLGHVPYEDVYMSSRFIEGAILSRLHKEGRVAPDNERNKTRFEADGRHRYGSSEIQVQKDKIHEDIPKEGMIGVDKASTKTKREKVEYKQIDGDRFVLKEGIDFEVEDGASIGLEFAGAYVKDPDPGIYEWIYDLDLTSMYPCIIMGLNVSPETKVAKIYDWDVYDFAEKPDKKYKVWIFSRSDWKHFSGPEDLQNWAKRNKYSVAANGAVYKNDRRGVIADLLEEWFENRQDYKARRNEARERGDEEQAEYYDKQQHNRKILINCFTPDHEIMTKEGVKNIEDVEVGEEVYSINPETGKRELKPITRTYRQDEYSGDIIKFKNDRVDIAVTPNHDMVFGSDLRKEKAGNAVREEKMLPPPTSKDDPVKLNSEDSERTYYQGPIVCVEVKENHTVLAGRNGTFNWTGQSVYGVLGLPVFRFYDLDNAEAVTATGVSTIKYTSKMGDHYYEKHGECEDDRLMKNVYSDTDSVFYSAIPLLDEKPEEMEEDEIINATIEKATELQEYLNDSYNYYAQKILNIPEGQHRFDIKQELVASRGIWMEAKKRYAQWIVNDEGDPTRELDVKGMDIVRSDFPPAFDDVMEEVVITILKENDRKKVDQIIMDFEDQLHDFGLFEIANPTGVGDASDYQEPEVGQYKKGAPVYFKAALAYNDLIDHFDLSYEKISDDSKIKWVYLHENPLGLDQVGFKSEDNPDRIMDFARQYADYDKMYNKALKSKLEDIYDAIDWDFPSAGKKRAEEFFQFS